MNIPANIKKVASEIWDDIKEKIVKNRNALLKRVLGFGIITYVVLLIFLVVTALEDIHSVGLLLFQVLIITVVFSILYFLGLIGLFLATTTQE